MKICPNCSAEITKACNKYCNSSCAASFNNRRRRWNDEVRQKISDGVKRSQNLSNCQSRNARQLAAVRYKKFHKIKYVNCKACGKLRCVKHTNPSQNCSEKCFRASQALHAIKQYGTGYGKSGHYRNIKCQSRFELVFVIWCIDHDIPIKRCDKVFTYSYQDKACRYNPDFIINDEIYEIKGRVTERDKIKFSVVPNLKVITDMKTYIEYVKNKYNLKYQELESLYEDYVPNNEYISCLHCKNIFLKTRATKFCSQSCSGKFQSCARKNRGLSI